MSPADTTIDESSAAVLSSAHDGSWDRSRLRRIESAAANAAAVADANPSAARDVVDDCVVLATRTLSTSPSKAERMFGRENLLEDTRRHATSVLAAVAETSPEALVPLVGDVFDLAVRDDDADCREALERAVDALAASAADSVHDAVAELVTVLGDDDVPRERRRRAAETLWWTATGDATVVVSEVTTLLTTLDDGRNDEDQTTTPGVAVDPAVAAETLRALAAVVADRGTERLPSDIDLAEFAAVSDTYLTVDHSRARAGAAAVMAALATHSPSAVHASVPSLFDALATPPAREDAETALRSVGRATPAAIERSCEALRATLSADNPSVRAAAARVAKAAGGGGVDPSGDPSVLVEAVPELTGALAECPDAREPAGWALEAVGEAHPRAIHEVLPALELAMSTADPDRRARATGVVRKTAAGDPTVVERLVPTLVDVLMTSDRAGAGSDARWALERVALATPAAIEAVIEELGRGLASDDPDVRERTAEVLVETAETDPASVLELVPALTEVVVSDPQAGTDASRALGPVARDYPDAVRDVLPELTTGLKRDDRDVQAHSAAVVRELAEGSPTAVERVVSTLVEVLFSSESARFDAAWALERVGAADPSALTPHLPRLRAGLASGQTILRERIASVLAETADADPKAVRAAVPELVRTVQECPDARPAATEALMLIGREYPDAIGAELGRLRTSLIGADESARAGTAEILASTAAGDADVVAEAVPELIDRLVDEDADTVRVSTSEALGYVASTRPDTVVACRDALARGLGSDDADVRVRTAAVVKRTAERTPSPEALAPLSDRLVDCLDAEEFEVRRDAATALAHIARDATIDLSGARLQLQRLAADPAASTALKSTVVELLSNTEGVVSPDLPSRDERS